MRGDREVERDAFAHPKRGKNGFLYLFALRPRLLFGPFRRGCGKACLQAKRIKWTVRQDDAPVDVINGNDAFVRTEAFMREAVMRVVT